MTKEKLICCRCKKEINRKKDRWVNIRDFDKEDQTGEIDMHLTCWKEMARESMQKAFNEKTKQISPVLNGLFGKLRGLTQNA